jgi:hypothetical protein
VRHDSSKHAIGFSERAFRFFNLRSCRRISPASKWPLRGRLRGVNAQITCPRLAE